jgi:hypothetical protein
VKIPVFVSCPTTLNDEQIKSRRAIDSQLHRFGLDPRALGRSDYPVANPLREVLLVARQCAGGVILGFKQLHVASGTRRPGTTREQPFENAGLPTAWNQIEAGILAAFGVPLLVFSESGVSDGIFDLGSSDLYVHRMPIAPVADETDEGLNEVFLRWQAKVREHYYRI